MAERLQTIAGELRSGKVVVYPTETLYAVGCRADCHDAVRAVARIKARPESKPLPLLVGDMAGLENVCGPVSGVALQLMQRFWPGPLSILVPALPALAPGVSDEQGMTSVRWTAHPVAAELSRLAGAPLVATSANMSGEPPASRPEELSSRVLAGVDAAYLDEPYPGGGEPSTVVQVMGDALRVIRIGAIPLQQLQESGFSLME